MFNKALLAKHCWTLIQNLDSLISHIIKAKYYPNSSFLEFELGKMPSFIWRSFMAAKDLLSHGIIWGIGDGHSIKIWGDKWLPNVGSLVVSPVSILHSDALVSELVDPSLLGWNCSLIDKIFSVSEARIIKNIPLCPSLPLNKIIWNDTSNGMFSVRSAYHLGLELVRKQEGEYSTRSIKNDFWKKALGYQSS